MTQYILCDVRHIDFHWRVGNELSICDTYIQLVEFAEDGGSGSNFSSGRHREGAPNVGLHYRVPQGVPIGIAAMDTTNDATVKLRAVQLEIHVQRLDVRRMREAFYDLYDDSLVYELSRITVIKHADFERLISVSVA